MNAAASIFEYIKNQEPVYDTQEVEIFDNYSWNMKHHLQMSVSFKNSKFTTGSNDFMRPFKNIVRPILNLRYRAEDIDVKDVILYVENRKKSHLSFLVKKYHDEVFVKEHDLDSFFDEAKEEKIDFGGCLVQKTDNARPEVLPLQSIAFCDQTDILGGPIGFKFNFSPDRLRQMSKKGWGDNANGATISIEELIVLATSEKAAFGVGERKNQISGKNIEVYVVHGNLPEHYLKDNNEMEKYIGQIQIVAFYYDEKERKGVILYRKEENESPLKFHTSKKIFGRALGEAGVEELFEAQIWTNFFELHKTYMLQAGSKIGLYTDDQAYANRNKIRDMENLEITTIAEGKEIRQIPTIAPANIQLFERSVNEWFEHAQFSGSATDPLLGKSPAAGTPFRLQERVVFEGKGIHEYRREKFAKFIEEIYRDWILPYITKQIVKGTEFLATLTSDEMRFISERMADNYADKKIADAIFEMEVPPERETLRQEFIQGFSKQGNKRWIKILKDEFRDAPLAISVNVAGKQKDLVQMVDKIVNIFRFVFANPQAFQQTMQIPGMAKAFNDILEFSGLSPVDFAAANAMMPPLPQEQIGQNIEQLKLPAGSLPAREPVIA